MALFTDNPIASVQLSLRGGWKNLLITTGAYAIIIFGTMLLWAGVDPKHIKSVAEGWAVAMMMIQTGVVLLFSVVRVINAVQNDHKSGIIESHRLMPITGLTASIGYIGGSIIGMLAIGLVTMAAGVVCCVVDGADTAAWMMGNVVLFGFLLLACSVGLLIGSYRRAALNLVVVLVVLAFFSHGMLLYALPGLMILVSPLTGHSIYNPRPSGDLFNTAHLLGFIGQMAVGILLIAAASRKFRRPDRSAFSAWLALLLLLAFVALNLIGMGAWRALDPDFLRYEVNLDSRVETQFVASALAALLLCLLPIAAVARQRRQPDPLSRPSFSPGIVSMPLLCALITIAMLAAPAIAVSDDFAKAGAAIALCIAAAIASMTAMLMRYQTTRRKSVGMIMAFLLLTWVAPLFAGVIYHEAVLDFRNANTAPWSITAFSPIGVMLTPWERDIRYGPGVAAQVAIAMVLVIGTVVAERGRRRQDREEMSAVAIESHAAAATSIAGSSPA